jgi:hypothetical protein
LNKSGAASREPGIVNAGAIYTCEARIESPRMTHTNTLDTMKLMDKLRGDMGFRYVFE